MNSLPSLVTAIVSHQNMNTNYFTKRTVSSRPNDQNLEPDTHAKPTQEQFPFMFPCTSRCKNFSFMTTLVFQWRCLSMAQHINYHHIHSTFQNVRGNAIVKILDRKHIWRTGLRIFQVESYSFVLLGRCPPQGVLQFQLNKLCWTLRLDTVDFYFSRQ